MSGTDLLVIVFGLFIGYWVVSKFSGNDKSKSQSAPDPEVQRRREKAEREEQDRQRQYQQQQRQAEEPRPAFWYEILNTSPNADIQEIRHAYKSLMRQYHPDKVASLGPELKELCERKTKEINSAYDRAMAERGAA